MKTTIDIADAILDEARAAASEDGVTVRSLVEEGLRQVLRRRRDRQRAFRLRDASFKGKGLQPGVELGDWHTVSAAIYDGRGG